jgi:hypothetical protein
MAVYWNLGLVARTSEQAEACIEFFRAKRLQYNGRDVALEIWQAQKADCWVVGVCPHGMSHGSPLGNDPKLTTDEARLEIARVFDQWLVEAPPFMAAFFGGEAYDFLLDEPLSESLEPEGINGLVVDQATWESLGEPEAARIIGKGRFAWPRSRVP